MNVPIGLAGLLLGAFTLVTRREAVPQLIGILAMENGAFLAGVAIAPGLPLIAELAASFDVLVIVLVMGILTQAIHEQIGTTGIVTLVDRGDEGTHDAAADPSCPAAGGTVRAASAAGTHGGGGDDRRRPARGRGRGARGPARHRRHDGRRGAGMDRVRRPERARPTSGRRGQRRRSDLLVGIRTGKTRA